MKIYGIDFSRNPEQQELCRLIEDNSKAVIFGIGKAGTGKNFAAFSAAIELVIAQDKYATIKYGRNPVQCGQDMGFLPGDLDEKYGPFLNPLYTTINSIVRLSDYHRTEKGEARKATIKYILNRIESMPIAFLRGDTWENSIIIVDECQNFDAKTLNTLMTRVGEHCKLIMLGSYNQIDDPKQARKPKCDFQRVVEYFTANKDYSAGIELQKSMRNKICVDIDESFEEIFKD